MKLSIFSITLLFSLLVSGLHAQCPIIPAPMTYVASDGQFPLESKLTVKSANLPKVTADYLSNQLESVYSINTESSETKGAIQFRKISNVPKDFYSIHVSDSIVITYSSDESCFYAVNSLLQLIRFEGESFNIGKCFLQDSPNFSWRGLHLDVSRHFFTVDEVKRYIDLMAFYKFNVLHWHLTDDQGWRIEIKQFPKLTEVGAFREKTLKGHYNDIPRVYDEQRSGGFYTQEEIKEIVKYAQDKYITIVPEIEMPGHARAAIAAYPELSCTGKKLPVPGEWGIFDDIFCSKPETIDFLQKVLDEVLVLFPSEYIHIGGDEAPKTRWKACPKCQKTMSENHLKDEHALQSYFIGKMDQYLTSKGRKLIGWDEILEGGLSPNAAVMSWRGDNGGIAAAKQGHYVVMTPTEFCYFDYYQSSHPSEPLAIGGFLPLEKVYEFNPYPAALSNEERSYVLGGQANVWTEYMSDFSEVEYMVYPRALAMSQVLWCSKKPDYETFKKVLLDYQIGYLKQHGVLFSQAVFYPQMEIFPSEKGLKVHFKGSTGNDKFNVIQTINESGLAEDKNVVLGISDTLYFERSFKRSAHHFELSPFETYEFEHSPFDIEIHSAIGLPIELLTQPNPKYSTHGNLALVDGIKGKRPWKGDEWLGFENDTVQFIVDLKKTALIQQLNLGFLSANGSWIYVPESVQLEVSADQKKWLALKKEPATENFTQKVGKKGRYVKVTVIAKSRIPTGMPGEGNHPWTFIDEVEIIY